MSCRIYQLFIICIISSVLLTGCKTAASEEQTVKHYDLDKPEKFFMPESLLEVSGITFYKRKSDTIYAIQDEQGTLFRLAWGVKNS